MRYFWRTGEKLLKMQIVIGLNSTALLESIAANRFILCLYSILKTICIKKFILDLRLSSKIIPLMKEILLEN